MKWWGVGATDTSVSLGELSSQRAPRTKGRRGNEHYCTCAHRATDHTPTWVNRMRLNGRCTIPGCKCEWYVRRSR